MTAISIAVAALIGYLVGSVLFAVVLSRRLHGVDIREIGSRNPGFTNVFRALGTRTGVLTLLGDLGKGAAAVALARWLLPHWLPGGPITLGTVAAAGALLGHALPLYHGFRGGKGVATAAGAFLCLVPASAGIAIAVWAVVLVAFRYMSVASMAGALTLPVHLTWLSGPEPPRGLVIAAWIVAAAIVLRHRSNLYRLLRGEEHRFPLKRT